jgi:DNA-binding IclR family transcriptional regulator
MASGYTVRVVDRAVDVLFCLSDAGGELSLREISARTGLDKATVHRILTTLGNRGLVRPGGQSGSYALDVGILRLSAGAFGGLEIRSIARPFMVELNRRAGETVALSVLTDRRRVYVDHVESQREVRWVPRIGYAEELYAGAAAKALLAHLPADEQEQIIEGASFAPSTPNTPKGPAMLRRQVAKVKKDGFAVTLGERYAGNAAIAAPIFESSGRPIAALTVAGPAETFTKGEVAAITTPLLDATERISRLLGYGARLPGIAAAGRG